MAYSLWNSAPSIPTWIYEREWNIVTEPQEEKIPPTRSPGWRRAYFLVDREVVNGNIIPYAITHPPGYNGSGGLIYVDVCVSGSHPDTSKLVGPLQPLSTLGTSWIRRQETAKVRCLGKRILRQEAYFMPKRVCFTSLVTAEWAGLT